MWGHLARIVAHTPDIQHSAPQKPAHDARVRQSYGWYTDAGLRTYIEEHGSKGVKAVHLARIKLGEDATNIEINAEVKRRCGAAYNERHLRRLNAERRRLIQHYNAGNCTPGGDILTGGNRIYMYLMLVRGGNPQPTTRNQTAKCRPTATRSTSVNHSTVRRQSLRN